MNAPNPTSQKKSRQKTLARGEVNDFYSDGTGYILLVNSAILPECARNFSLKSSCSAFSPSSELQHFPSFRLYPHSTLFLTPSVKSGLLFLDCTCSGCSMSFRGHKIIKVPQRTETERQHQPRTATLTAPSNPVLRNLSHYRTGGGVGVGGGFIIFFTLKNKSVKLKTTSKLHVKPTSA